MTQKIQLCPSGIPLVDIAWGGLYRGGTYLLIGPRKSGRTLLALQYALECAQQREVCLFFTSMRPKDLLIHAASIDLDLQHYMNQNLIIVVRVSVPENLEDVDDPDGYLADYVKDIIPVIEQYKPNKVVFDELTPFVGIKDIRFLKNTFLQTIESIEDKGIITLYTMGEPANPTSQKIIDTLINCSTGSIQLQKQTDTVNKSNPGVMTIIPNIGHTEGKFSANYFIEPNKGISVDYVPSQPEEKKSGIISTKEIEQLETLADIESPGNILTISNIYSLEDFELILNNRIAMYQITGKLFALVSIRVDELAIRKKLITLTQLRNAIRLSVDKKDKICTIKNTIFVMIPLVDGKDTRNLAVKIKSNLPDDDSSYKQAIFSLISIYSVTVNDEITNAESMIAEVLKGTETKNAKPGGL